MSLLLCIETPQDTIITSTDLRAGCLGLNPSSTSNEPYDLGKVTYSLCASVFSSDKWG